MSIRLRQLVREGRNQRWSVVRANTGWLVSGPNGFSIVGACRETHEDAIILATILERGFAGMSREYRKQSRVPQIAPTHGQERPKPANVGTGEGTGLEGALIGARETKPERPREGE